MRDFLEDDADLAQEAYVAADRVDVALAEMGWGHLEVSAESDADTPFRCSWKIVVGGHAPLPSAVIWMAFKVSGVPVACWECWSAGLAQSIPWEDVKACTDDSDCRHPGHPYPPREMLVPRKIAS